MFLYNINNDLIEDGLIKKVEVKFIDLDKYEVIKNGLGMILILINFINYRNEKMFLKDYKFNLIGFKGYDKDIIEFKKIELKDEYKSLLLFKNKILLYLMKIK